MGKASFRAAFDTVAEQYDEARPRYSDEIIDTIVRVSGIAVDASLLEIGPGTGQATIGFAKRGYKITAVEIGERLAELCRKNLAAYPKVRIITGSFEHVRFPSASFDLLYAATAFHWIPAEKGFRKAHNLLKSGGYLAIIDTRHVSDEGDDVVFLATQPISVKYKVGAERHNNFVLPRRDELKADPMDEKFFTPVFFSTFPLAIRYTAKEYARLLGTYSPILTLEPAVRTAFLTEIEQLITEKFGGSVVRHSAMKLTIGRRI